MAVVFSTSDKSSDKALAGDSSRTPRAVLSLPDSRRWDQRLECDAHQIAMALHVFTPSEIARRFKEKISNDKILLKFRLQRRRFPLFLLTSVLHGRANGAGVLPIKGLRDRGRDIPFLCVGDDHSHPGAGLENCPVPTREKEEGEKGNSYGDSTRHDCRDFRRLSGWASEKIFWHQKRTIGSRLSICEITFP
jgi:hypothetical protein